MPHKLSKSKTTSNPRERRRDAELWNTAIHEAGHVMMAVWVGHPIHHATIKPGARSLGMIVERGMIPQWLREDAEGALTAARAMWLEKQVRCLLAGGIAETIASGRRKSPGARDDHQKAIECAFLRCGSLPQAEAWLNWLSISTREVLNRLWSSVTLIAERLLHQKTLSDAEIRAALRLQYSHALEPSGSGNAGSNSKS
jgi:hypothetical protein